MRKVFCETLNVSLTLPEYCTRIVSLSPSLTETFFLAGLGDRLVGVSGYCVRPPEARRLPIVGSYGSLREERLHSLEPDLILMTTGYQRPLAEQLVQKGYPVYAIPLPPTLAHIIAQCAEALVVAGYPDRATWLTKKLWQAWHQEQTRLSQITLPKRLYLEIDLGGPVTFGAYSYITDFFRHCGVQTPWQDAPHEWLTPRNEDLVAFQPEVIIFEPKMFGRRNRTITEVQERFRQRGLAALHAVQQGAIWITPGIYDFFAHHRPSFFLEVIPWFRQQAQQWAEQHQASPDPSLRKTI